jgi:predicted TPR repeat methyltransferase
MNKMLDLGGGAGLIGICIVDSHPTMEGVIFDQPAVVQVAEEFIKEYNMESRVKTMGGNYMTDDIGENYDLVLASQTLGLAGNELNVVLKKVYDSLNFGGVLITMHEGLSFEKTKPSSMVLASVGTVLRGSKEMRFFEAGETAEAMRQAGFKSIYRFPVELDCGEEEITIARK